MTERTHHLPDCNWLKYCGELCNCGLIPPVKVELTISEQASVEKYRQSKRENQRRLADYIVAEDLLFGILSRFRDHWFRITMPDLPLDARFIAVHHSWERAAFFFRFQSETYPMVYDGSPPEIRGELHLELHQVPEPVTNPELEAMLQTARVDRFAVFALLAFLSRDLGAGETNADRVAASRRLVQNVRDRINATQNVFEAIRQAFRETGTP